jgi:uncharacterized UPF0160 family protein
MKVAVHNGQFHADEAFAIATLQMLGPVEYVRTRDEETLRGCDLRVDVGRKYNPDTGDYDHHQPETAGKRANGIPYAAFGLVWKHFGKQLCSKEVVKSIDAKLVQVLDATDTGFNLFKSEVDEIMPFGVQSVIDILMPTWKEDSDDIAVDTAFAKAVELASKILQRMIKIEQDELEGQQIIRGAIKSAADERLIILDKYAPWKQVVIQAAPNALFVVLPSWPDADNGWVLHAINSSPDTFDLRKSLPRAWSGKAGLELAELTGVPDAKFCHLAGFIAVCKTKEGCLSLARQALKS